MLRKSDCSEKGAPQKKQLLFPRILESLAFLLFQRSSCPKKSQHMREGKLPFPDPDKYSWGISYEYLTGWP